MNKSPASILPLLLSFIVFASIVPLASQAKEPKAILTDCQSLVSILENSNQEEALLVYNWLANTTETRMHQLRGATGNQLFVHESGRFEAVYDENGKHVDDDINNGSLNYAHPQKDPVNHFTLDILPWVCWGYSRKDPTSVEERIIGLSQALGGGLVSAQQNHSDYVKKELTKEELGESPSFAKRFKRAVYLKGYIESYETPNLSRTSPMK